MAPHSPFGTPFASRRPICLLAPHLPHGAPMPFRRPHALWRPICLRRPHLTHGAPMPFWRPICLLAPHSIWLHAMGSLPFISASCHGFIAFSFGFMPRVHCRFIWLHCHGLVAIPQTHLPSGAPKSICLLAPPNLFAFLAPHLPFGAPFHQMCNYNTYDNRS
jgi:hypothetical protein